MPFSTALPLPAAAAPAMCLLPDPAAIWLHVLSDGAIGLAYLSIPAALLVVLLRRRDLAFPWLLGLFALFILACGSTHLVHAYAAFRPMPWGEALVKAVTAAISVVVAVTLWPVLPRILALRSPAALAREVEERRNAEVRARASEARLAAFINNLAEAVFVLRIGADGSFQIESVNPAFERMLGLDAASVVDRRPEEVLPSALVAQALPRWRQAAAQGRTLDYEIGVELPAGRRSWQTVLVPMRGPDGRVERLLGSARDITATRRLQAGLVQSARLATVGTMCAGLAHEASQPLNTATLWLRRARASAEPLAAAQRTVLLRAVAVVEDQLRRAGDLVARIRGLAGDEPDGGEAFDAAVAVGAALRIAGTQYAADGIDFALHADEQPLGVRGSAGRLEQAVLQLLANARDAVVERRLAEPDAPARIDVFLRREAGRVVVEVRDSGQGIAEAARDAIFDPFFTTKPPGRGVGLGLPFAAGVARGMGGGLEAWNLATGGACFRMELAVCEAAGPAGRLAASPVAA
ncbi:sensor histidine kinase [Falsiroseomonas oryzae]|uniref:sensor histidine kinase n=1 Tax=Falsiroseomonas oryzae TaxID=2766473 RepID=UPI0022EA1C17|nr:PAS domain-containing protein [Roseomonas sp. MO-31]